MSVATAPAPFGELLRGWRRHRRLSQMALALEAGVSTRHLSFLETGRARPSAAMVLRLAERLDVPLGRRDELLLGAGHAPAFGRRDYDAPELGPVRAVLERVLRTLLPAPALVVDRQWELLAANDAIGVLLDGVAPWLLEPPVNVLRLALHPEGVAPRVVNLAEWRAHLLARLRAQAVAAADPGLRALHAELVALPGGDDREEEAVPDPRRTGGVAVPVRLRDPAGGELAFLSTLALFENPLDATVAELALEAFHPADERTEARLAELAAPGAR